MAAKTNTGAILMASVVVLAGAAGSAAAAVTLVPGTALDLGANATNQAPAGIAIDAASQTAYVSLGFAGVKPVNLATGAVGAAWQQPAWNTTPAFSDNTIRPYNGVATGGGQVFVANNTGVAVFQNTGAFQFQLYPFPRTGEAGTGTAGAHPQVQTNGVTNGLRVDGSKLYVERYDYQAGTGDRRAMAAFDISSPITSTTAGTQFFAPTGYDSRVSGIRTAPTAALASNGASFMDLTNNTVIGSGAFTWRDSTGNNQLLGPANMTESGNALLANGTDGAYAFRAGAMVAGGPIRLYVESISKVGGVWRHTSGTGTTIDQEYGRIFADGQLDLFLADGTTSVTSVRDMEIVGNYLYVSAQGLSVYDLTTPLTPTLLARWDAPGQTHDMAIDGDTVYIGVDPATGNHLLQPISVVVPEPVSMATLSLIGAAGLLRRRRK